MEAIKSFRSSGEGEAGHGFENHKEINGLNTQLDLRCEESTEGDAESGMSRMKLPWLRVCSRVEGLRIFG